jgi:hypothetical protein
MSQKIERTEGQGFVNPKIIISLTKNLAENNDFCNSIQFFKGLLKQLKN